MRVILLAILVLVGGCISPGGAELSNWPNGYSSAVAITFDTEIVTESQLKDLVNILESRGLNATFFVVAGYFQDKPNFLELLRDYEVASLGWYHADWKDAELTREFQQAEIEKAHEWFARRGFWVSGFRTPYLVSNRETFDILSEIGYAYDSSRYYDFLPYMIGNMVEIPLSVNYDLYWDERSIRYATMPTFLAFQKSRDEGGLFVFSSHVNTVHSHPKDFVDLLDFMRKGDGVWFATCEDIAEWWRRRGDLELSKSGETITVLNKGRASVEGVTVKVPGQRMVEGALSANIIDGHTYAVLHEIQPGKSISIAAR